MALLSSGFEAAAASLRGTALRGLDGRTIRIGEGPSASTLLVFLALLPESGNTPSRRQVVGLRSLQQQYGNRGLRIVAVDRSPRAQRSRQRSAASALKNASYDLNLNFPLARDPNGRLTHAIRLRKLPTMVLIDAHGAIQHRWQGETSSAVLAQDVERLIGGPLARLPSMPDTR